MKAQCVKLYLTAEELQVLRGRAGHEPLSSYVRRMVIGGEAADVDDRPSEDVRRDDPVRPRQRSSRAARGSARRAPPREDATDSPGSCTWPTMQGLYCPKCKRKH